MPLWTMMLQCSRHYCSSRLFNTIATASLNGADVEIGSNEDNFLFSHEKTVFCRCQVVESSVMEPVKYITFAETNKIEFLYFYVTYASLLVNDLLVTVKKDLHYFLN
ncbi:hypothetical protein M514_07499 [Trichuris suis]|uniref:Uncharacterized protein n=1 Tax=Trichuris suis TaxID=68888 RepID=A0A085NE62_9BILA|nr:hypothetical protein M513_07499 [Trichuris suis]KFD67758.1 hypothetical protein M514_07499 [Trichuris suis]